MREKLNDDSIITKETKYDSDEIDPSEEEVTIVSFNKAVLLVSKLSLEILIFSIPQTDVYLSFLMSNIMLIIFGCFNWLTYEFLTYACDKYKIYDYSVLVRKVLGRYFEFLFNFAISLSAFITIIAYYNICKIL